MFCEKCGKEIQEGQAICLNCGAALYDQNSSKTAKVKPTKTILFNEPPKRATLKMCLFIAFCYIVNYAVWQIFNRINFDTNSISYTVCLNLCSLLVDCIFLGLGFLFSVGYKHWEEKVAFISIGVMSVHIIGSLSSLKPLLGIHIPIDILDMIINMLLSVLLGIGLICFYNKFCVYEKTLYYEGKIGTREHNKYCCLLILIPYILATAYQIFIFNIYPKFIWGSEVFFAVMLGVSVITSLAYKNKADRLVFVAVSLTLSTLSNMVSDVLNIIVDLIGSSFDIYFYSHRYVIPLSILVAAVIGVVIIKKYNSYVQKLYY